MGNEGNFHKLASIFGLAVFSLSSFIFINVHDAHFLFLTSFVCLCVCVRPLRTVSPWPTCPGTAVPVSGVRPGQSTIRTPPRSPSPWATWRTTPPASAPPWNATSWARQVRGSGSEWIARVSLRFTLNGGECALHSEVSDLWKWHGVRLFFPHLPSARGLAQGLEKSDPTSAGIQCVAWITGREGSPVDVAVFSYCRRCCHPLVFCLCLSWEKWFASRTIVPRTHTHTHTHTPPLTG